jgi:hypothetical protein
VGEREREVYAYAFNAGVDKYVFGDVPVGTDVESDGIAFSNPDKGREETRGGIEEEYVHDDACGGKGGNMGEYGWRVVVFRKAETDELELHDPVIVVRMSEDVCHCKENGPIVELDATFPEFPSLTRIPVSEGGIGGDVPADDFSALCSAEGVAGGDWGEPIDVLEWRCRDDGVRCETRSTDPPCVLETNCSFHGIYETVSG